MQAATNALLVRAGTGRRRWGSHRTRLRLSPDLRNLAANAEVKPSLRGCGYNISQGLVKSVVSQLDFLLAGLGLDNQTQAVLLGDAFGSVEAGSEDEILGDDRTECLVAAVRKRYDR